MPRITSVEELKKYRESVREQVAVREQGEEFDDLVQIYVGMDDSGLEAGAKQIYHSLWEQARGTDTVVLQTAKIADYKEPVVKVFNPKNGSEVVFEGVTEEKAKQILTSYLEKGDLMDGIVLSQGK